MASFENENKVVCGVLLVDGITYGRLNNKLLYKCIPDDGSLEHALVPYEDKNISFSKVKANKYVTMRLESEAGASEAGASGTSTSGASNASNVGILTEVFGDVDDLEAYIQYQLACKNMSNSISSSNSIKPLNTAVIRAIREKPLNNILSQYYLVEDRLAWPIISIDPFGCQDIDDAIGFRRLPDGQTLLSIYISNVPFIMDHYNLWDKVSDRISTIYFSHKKVPMLPFSLSENKCSLLQGEERVAFTLDVYIYAGMVKRVNITNCLIKVEKNYAYEADELLRRADYKDILKVVKHLNQESVHYLGYVDEVKDSHDLVEFCMIMMNHECAKLLKAKKKGIFRSAKKKEVQEDNVLEDYKKVLVNAPELTYILQGIAGEYCLADNIKPHELIGKGLSSYVHITSPIRRIVDIINMLELQMGISIHSPAAEEFLKKWTSPEAINTLNIKTKAIRRLQNDVELLHLYEKNNGQVYTGILLGVGGNPPEPPSGEILVANALVGGPGGGVRGGVPHRVYVPELKLLTKIYSDKQLPTYSIAEFTVHLFLDEAKMSKKVRLQIL
jgi:hypothetical protein